MKVKSLFIKDYNQFKDFELDLTYPKGHPKEGKPLDKVCIIGQSGTGKTTLLRFVEYVCCWSRDKKNTGKINTDGIRFVYKESIRFSQKTPYKFKNIHVVFSLGFNTILDFHIESDYSVEINDGFDTVYYSMLLSNYKTIFIGADLIYKFDELIAKNDTISLKGVQFIDVSQVDLSQFWNSIKNEVDEFQKKLINRRNEFSKLATDSKTSAKTLEEEIKKLREWEEKQVNPLKKLGDEFLDKILNKFQVRVKTEVDFEDIGFIKLETLQGKPIAGDLLSTGTKQVILTALPLYALKPENSVILFDEPERSLYPDIQTEIIEFYTGLGKDCQFFFATHSPIIASSFEPWEIVELKFNEEGNVYREKYFEGENHVDNYFINPQYLKWDSILTKVFDLDVDSNPERIKKMMELAQIRSKIKKLNGSATLEEKQELLKKFEKLANLLDWEFDEKD